MGVEHAPEVVWRAQELYCVERRSFAAVAKAVGVADSTLRLWAKKFAWRTEREAIARAESEIRANMVKARAHMLARLLDSEKPGDAAQGAYGFSALEKVELEKQKALARQAAAGLESQAATARSQDENKAAAQEFLLPDGLDDAQRLALLEQAIDRQLAFVLSSPVEDLSRRVKEIKAAMDVLAAIKGKDAAAPALAVSFEE